MAAPEIVVYPNVRLRPILLNTDVPSLYRFLIIDHNADGRFLLSKTLLRKFPQSIALECAHADTATTAAATEKLDLIVAHNTGDLTGCELIDTLRAANRDVPILAVTGNPNLGPSLLQSGASQVLNFDEWLLAGNVVEALLRERNGRSAIPFPNAPASPAA